MTDKTSPEACPFCGGTKFQQNTKAKGYFIKKAAERAGKDMSNHLIRCTKCGAKGPLKHSEAEALTAWNTRANADARLVEALREAIGAIEDDSGLDEAICCSGHDCGCRASTHRDLLLHNLRAALSEVSHG